MEKTEILDLLASVAQTLEMSALPLPASAKATLVDSARGEIARAIAKVKAQK